MITLSLFESVRDFRPKRLSCIDLNDLYQRLKPLVSEPAAAKEHRPLVSPAIYRHKQHRAAENASAAEVMILDADHPDNNIVHAMMELQARGLAALVYTTWSHVESDWHRFRTILPLMQPLLDADEYKTVQNALTQGWLSQFKFDRAPKSIASLFYLPTPNEAGETGDIYLLDGAPLSPVDVLKDLPAPLPTTVAPSVSASPSAPQAAGKSRTRLYYHGLTNTNMIATKWLTEYFGTTTATPGGWHIKMYQVLVHIAGRCKWANYPLTVDQLFGIACDLDAMDANGGRYYTNQKLRREAEDAFRYVG